jgi:hypothetical protein
MRSRRGLEASGVIPARGLRRTQLGPCVAPERAGERLRKSVAGAPATVAYDHGGRLLGHMDHDELRRVVEEALGQPGTSEGRRAREQVLAAFGWSVGTELQRRRRAAAEERRAHLSEALAQLEDEDLERLDRALAGASEFTEADPLARHAAAEVARLRRLDTG